MNRFTPALALFLACSAAYAGPFASGNLVVMHVSGQFPGGAGAIELREYSLSGSPTGNVVALPSNGADAVCMPDFTNHDRHLHRSTDGRFLLMPCYGAAPSLTDPSGSSSTDAPRVIAVISASGVVDLTTRITSSYDYTSVRGATSTDGTQIWIGGDNASGAVVNGGLQFTLRGSSSATNLSQVQSMGQAHTPDNIRDVNIFDNQLYDCSGSSSSVGKGVFVVGSGLPTSGSQRLSSPLNGSDGASASSFALLDMNPSVPGPDVLYTATSAAGDGVHKYVKLANGSWESRGYTAYSGIEHVIAMAEPDGNARVYAGGPQGVALLIDGSPLGGTLSGAVTSFIISAPAGVTLGGLDFSPTDECTDCAPCPADFNQDGGVDGGDVEAFFLAWEAGDSVADVNQDGGIDGGDVETFFIAWEAGGCN